MATATFGAGCFWGVEAKFGAMSGVSATAVGYMGGRTERPTYEDVCTDRTGHAEVVHLEYDPAQISYRQLLEAFFAMHDPTTRDRQGPDHGTQYRSVVFFHTPEQAKEAQELIAGLDAAHRFPRKIVTQVTPAGPFWRAEEYHQKYLEKRGGGSCHI